MPDVPTLEHRRAVAEKHIATLLKQSEARGKLTDREAAQLATRRHEVEQIDQALAAQSRASDSLTADLPALSDTPTSHELRQRRGALLAKAEAILELAGEQDSKLSVQELALYERLVAEVEALNQPLQAAEQRERETREALAARSKKQREDSMNSNTTDPRIEAVSNVTVKAFENSPKGREAAFEAGQFVHGILLGDVKAQSWLAGRGYDVDHTIRAAHSAGVNTAGGVLVPEEFSRAIIRLVEQYGVARRLSRVVQMGSDTMNIPRRSGGLTPYFVGEGIAITESDTTWSNVALSVKKMAAMTRVSSELSEDSIVSVADMLAFEFGVAFAQREDECLLTGTGTSTYGGMTGALVKAIDGSHALATVAAASGHDLLSELDVDDLLSLVALIPEYALPGSVWLTSAPGKALIFDSLRAAAGGITAADMAAGFMDSFLGYPIVTSPVMPGSASTDYSSAAMLAFGNLALASTMGVRRDIRISTTDARYFAEDQVALKATERFDIVVHDLGSASVKSPFAVLTGAP